MTTAILIIAVAAALAALLIAISHAADRVIDEVLGAELREIDRRRQAGIKSGFDAGWHGGSRPRPGSDLDEIDRNARAYGWSVGRGAPLAEQIHDVDPENPFLNPAWRNRLGGAS